MGGMGVVYAARHVRLGRALAVKILRPEFVDDATTVQRFHQEAEAASRIGSPHIVEIIDLGTCADGSPFLVMERLEGTTLSDLLAAVKTMEAPRIADILGQMLSGLAAAHDKGIVHRDLKPSNVFLTRFGERGDFVKLLDFGISKVLSGEKRLHLTRTGVLVGTPSYMAPEQVLGRKDIDHRVDVWAAGVILFLALTGRKPFEGLSPGEQLAAIVVNDVRPVRDLRPDVDPGLEAIVRRALRRDREERFPTAEAFREALAPYRAGRPSTYATSPVTTPARLPAQPPAAARPSPAPPVPSVPPPPSAPPAGPSHPPSAPPPPSSSAPPAPAARPVSMPPPAASYPPSAPPPHAPSARPASVPPPGSVAESTASSATTEPRGSSPAAVPGLRPSGAFEAVTVPLPSPVRHTPHPPPPSAPPPPPPPAAEAPRRARSPRVRRAEGRALSWVVVAVLAVLAVVVVWLLATGGGEPPAPAADAADAVRVE
jgi:serine/threonine-protein kinase